MLFDNEKKMCLEKLKTTDKSKIGSVDKQIAPLVEIINAHKDYYTTSSCAGRILLFKESLLEKKKDSGWLLSSHDKVSFKSISDALESLPEENIWFRMEPPILHICARDMQKADILLKIANDTGFRRSALLSFKKRIVIEIMIPEKMDAPIAEKGKLIVDENYIKTLIKHGNLRLKKSREKLKKFELVFISLSKPQSK
jgi:tRNA wybutosine-synthesizing protein 3